MNYVVWIKEKVEGNEDYEDKMTFYPWLEEIKVGVFMEASVRKFIPQSGSGKIFLIVTFFLHLVYGGNEGDLTLWN